MLRLGRGETEGSGIVMGAGAVIAMLGTTGRGGSGAGTPGKNSESLESPTVGSATEAGAVAVAFLAAG